MNNIAFLCVVYLTLQFNQTENYIMNRKNLTTIVGFLLFLLGFIGIVINMVGLHFALTDWVSYFLGSTIGFIFKILLVITGVVLVILANCNDEDRYDEYFDGNAFK